MDGEDQINSYLLKYLEVVLEELGVTFAEWDRKLSVNNKSLQTLRFGS